MVHPWMTGIVTVSAEHEDMEGMGHDEMGDMEGMEHGDFFMLQVE